MTMSNCTNIYTVNVHVDILACRKFGDFVKKWQILGGCMSSLNDIEQVHQNIGGF